MGKVEGVKNRGMSPVLGLMQVDGASCVPFAEWGCLACQFLKLFAQIVYLLCRGFQVRILKAV